MDSASARAFAPKALCIDIETAFDDPFELRKLGGWRCDTGGELSVASVRHAKNLATDLDALAEGAAFVVGHHVLRHDLPVLRRHFPKLRAPARLAGRRYAAAIADRVSTEPLSPLDQGLQADP